MDIRDDESFVSGFQFVGFTRKLGAQCKSIMLKLLSNCFDFQILFEKNEIVVNSKWKNLF